LVIFRFLAVRLPLCFLVCSGTIVSGGGVLRGFLFWLRILVLTSEEFVVPGESPFVLGPDFPGWEILPIPFFLCLRLSWVVGCLWSPSFLNAFFLLVRPLVWFLLAARSVSSDFFPFGVCNRNRFVPFWVGEVVFPISRRLRFCILDR